MKKFMLKTGKITHDLGAGKLPTGARIGEHRFEKVQIILNETFNKIELQHHIDYLNSIINALK